MPTPLEFMRRYRNIKVSVPIDDHVAQVTRVGSHVVQLNKYFMMDWNGATEERRDYDAVTGGSKRDTWFQANKERIRTAAMGKGAPEDYGLALVGGSIEEDPDGDPGNASDLLRRAPRDRLFRLRHQLPRCVQQEVVLEQRGAQHQRGVVFQRVDGCQ